MFENLFIVEPGVLWAKGEDAANIFNNISDNAFAAGHAAGVHDTAVNALAVVGAVTIAYGAGYYGTRAYRRHRRNRTTEQT